MRKIILPLLVLALLALALPAALAAQPSVMYVTTDSGSGVHLRSTPDTSDDSNIIMTVPYGAEVQIKTIMADVPFAQVTYNGTAGYMEMDYLSTTPPPAKPSGGGGGSSSGSSSFESELAALYDGFVPTNYQAEVVPTDEYVNLRWAPTLEAPVRSEYHQGALLQVLSDNGTWSEVYDEAARMSGYMESQFLQDHNLMNTTPADTQG